MKAWSTIFKVGLLLPCFAVATNEEEFSLVLHLHNGLCLTSECIGCLAFGEPCDPADPRQRWYMDGRAIVNSKFGRCLELAEDNDVLLTDCHGGRSQEWEFDYLRDHVLGELQWVRYLQNMKCMRFHPDKNSGLVYIDHLHPDNSGVVYIDTCADVSQAQFLKLTKWPYSRNTPKDVASSCCLDQKCPERSNSSHSDCRCPEGVQSQSDLWFMVPVLLVFCGALGWIWKGSKGDKPTGLEQQVRSKSPHGQAREKKLDTMDATILHNIYSTVTEIAAAIDGQRGSDSSSDCTVGSWTHVTSGQPCCFLPDAYFKVMTDDGEICEKQAKMLFKGTRVIAANGTPIEVLHPPEQHQVDAVIKLQVGSASLVVSPDHRILIPGNKTIQAKHLEEGSEVFLDGTEAKAKLTSFEWNHVPTMVVKIAFKPDIPVAAFMWSPSILSKGSRDKPRVRRGTSTRAPEGGDALTIPDTEPPLTP